MEPVIIKKELFGKNVEFELKDILLDVAEEIVEKAYAEGLRLQKIFNFYDSNSELSILNSKREKDVSPELLEVLKKSISYSKISGGTYDVSLGKSISARKNGEKVKTTCSYKDILIEKNKVKLTNSDVLIDLGSIAKGYITDKMADVIRGEGLEDFLIDARGDIFVGGEEILGIKNPRGEGEIGFVKVKNEGIATSGDYHQFVGGYENSHILNQSDLISVTVITQTLAEADVYATMIFTSTKEAREKFIEDNKSIKVLSVDLTGKTKKFNGFEFYLEDNK